MTPGRAPVAPQRADHARGIDKEVDGEDGAPDEEEELVEEEQLIGLVSQQEQPDAGSEYADGGHHEEWRHQPHRQSRRALLHVRTRVRVVAGEAIAGAAQLQQDRWHQYQSDEHVEGEEAADQDDRDALGDQQDGEDRADCGGEDLVSLEAAEALAPVVGDRARVASVRLHRHNSGPGPSAKPKGLMRGLLADCRRWVVGQRLEPEQPLDDLRELGLVRSDQLLG